MFTTGVPRYEHSLMPADELPIRHAVTFSSAMKSLTGTSVMNRIFRTASGTVSRKCRRLSAISPVPASGFGQIQIAGRSSDETARSVSSRCRRFSCSVVTGCWITSRNGCVTSISWPTP